MTALRRRLAPAPARRLVRDAGPPTAWVAVAFVIGGLAGFAIDLTRGIGLAGFLAVLLVAVTVPSLVDVDGWRIRLGMAWLAVEQRRRQSDLPRTSAGAERWLARSGESASTLTRASVELMAGNVAAARTLIEAAPRDEPEDAARVARMLAAVEGLETGNVDPGRPTPPSRPCRRSVVHTTCARSPGRPHGSTASTAARGATPLRTPAVASAPLTSRSVP